MLIKKLAATKRPSYVARLARNVEEVRRAQRLRFEIFNLELNEGLAESHFSGLDTDPFDSICDHLIVEQVETGDVVGTYRLQTGERAAANIGYYSEREFDFAPYEPFRREMIELGRACVRADHRNFNLLHLLWRGIATYAKEHGSRFLVGCSSLTSQDPLEGMSMYHELRERFVARPDFRTEPQPEFRCELSHARDSLETKNQASAKLLRAYLAIGAKICGPPALDREFGTIDFLTLLDLQDLPAIVRSHFLR
jgi:putative hemolysin